MKYRTLRSTGLEVSEIIFGGGAVGGLLIGPDRDTQAAAVRRALEHGINWFDTAPSYGDGQSEENLGAILEELGAHPRVSTKVSLLPEHFADLAGEVRRSVEGSLRRLRRDSVDLVILHNATTKERGDLQVSLSIDDVLGEGGVADGLARLVEEGLTGLLGFTGAGDPSSLRRLVDSGRFQAVQVFHSLVNPSAGRVLPPDFPGDNYENLIGVAASRGLGVFNIRVLAAGAVVAQGAGSQANEALGRVTREAGAGADEATPGTRVDDAVRRMTAVHRVLEGVGGTSVQKALRFALANPGISGVLVGFSTQTQIDEAVASVDMDPIPDRVMRELDELFASSFAAQ